MNKANLYGSMLLGLSLGSEYSRYSNGMGGHGIGPRPDDKVRSRRSTTNGTHYTNKKLKNRAKRKSIKKQRRKK